MPWDDFMEIERLHCNPEHIHSKRERHSSCNPSFGRVESEGWRYKSTSKISKSVCCAISLPPFYASLLAEEAPWALGQFCGWEDPGQNFRLLQGLWGNCRLSTKFAWKTKQSTNKPLPFWQQRDPETEKIFPAIRLREDSMQAWQQTWLGNSACRRALEFGANQRARSWVHGWSWGQKTEPVVPCIIQSNY